MHHHISVIIINFTSGLDSSQHLLYSVINSKYGLSTLKPLRLHLIARPNKLSTGIKFYTRQQFQYRTLKDVIIDTECSNILIIDLCNSANTLLHQPPQTISHAAPVVRTKSMQSTTLVYVFCWHLLQAMTFVNTAKFDLLLVLKTNYSKIKIQYMTSFIFQRCFLF